MSHGAADPKCEQVRLASIARDLEEDISHLQSQLRSTVLLDSDFDKHFVKAYERLYDSVQPDRTRSPYLKTNLLQSLKADARSLESLLQDYRIELTQTKEAIWRWKQRIEALDETAATATRASAVTDCDTLCR